MVLSSNVARLQKKKNVRHGTEFQAPISVMVAEVASPRVLLCDSVPPPRGSGWAELTVVLLNLDTVYEKEFRGKKKLGPEPISCFPSAESLRICECLRIEASSGYLQKHRF